MNITVAVKVVGAVDIDGRTIQAGNYVASLDIVERHRQVEFRVEELHPGFSSACQKALLTEVGPLSPHGTYYRRLAEAVEVRAVISHYPYRPDRAAALVFYEGSVHVIQGRRFCDDDFWPEWKPNRDSGWVIREETRRSTLVGVAGAVLYPPNGFPHREITLEYSACQIQQALEKAKVVLRGKVGCTSYVVLDGWRPPILHAEEIAAKHYKVDEVVMVGFTYDREVPKSRVKPLLKLLSKAGFGLCILHEDAENYLQWRIEPLQQD